MAWTSTIVQKGIQDKSFLVSVSYTNGALQFVESLDLTGSSLQNLSDRVAARLSTLETTQLLMPSVLLGPFVPTVAVVSAITPLQTFRQNMAALRNAQELVNIGVITTADPAYVSAFNNVKTTYDPSFIGQF